MIIDSLEPFMHFGPTIVVPTLKGLKALLALLNTFNNEYL